MKVINKLFVIALLLSLIFSISAIAAADNLENMTFEQSNMEDVSIETLNVPSEDTQEINTVEDDSSVNDAEDRLQVGNEDELTLNGGTFADVQSEIDRTVDGGTIYLNGKTYYATENKAININKNITIIGGSSLNPNDCAVFEARDYERIFSIYGKIGNEITVTLKSIIFQNGYSKNSYGGAINSRANLYLDNCHFFNNTARSGGAVYCAGSTSYDPSDSGYYYGYMYYCESYWTNDYTNWTNYYKNKYGKDPYEVLYPDYTLDFRDCTFENNNATLSYGGAIKIGEGPGYGYGYDKYLLIKNSTFINNTADDDGGAIEGNYNGYSYDNHEQGILNCTFIDNSAGRGGAIRTTTSLSSINCTFIRNSANKGGAIYGVGSVSNSKFINNSADYGGALYLYWVSSVFNNYFYNNHALNSSNAMYFDDTSVKLKGNIIEGDNCEIYVNNKQYNGFSGLNVIVLDNQTVKFCEGKIKIYAFVTDDMENKVASENFTFLVGDKEFTTILRDSIAEIEYNAILSDSGTIVKYKPQKYDKTANVYTGKLEIIPYGVVIDFNDAIGYSGKTLQIPIHIRDAAGHPLEGVFKVYYNGNDYGVPFTNGKKDLTISLPNEATSFELTIEYDNVIMSHTVTVLESSPVVPVIEMPTNETGYTGRTVTIPVNIHDKDGNPLDGVITVSYNGQEKTLTLINGTADVLIGLPVYETFFELSVTYNGKSAVCLVTVVEPHVVTIANITLPHSVSGNISKSITIPVSVVDQNGTPLKGDIIISYNGNERTQTLTNGQANVVITLPNHETTFELIITYNGNVKSCLVEVIDPTNHTDVVIKVAESVKGNVSQSIVVPINVTDSKGNPLKGEITAYYNGMEKTFNLIDGKANAIISLPAIETTFELIINYKGHVETCLVQVNDPKPHNPTIIPVVTIPESMEVKVGRTILIQVDVFDTNGNPLNGTIAVYYNNLERTLTLVNGTTNIIIPSQNDKTSFEVTVDYEGVMKHCIVNVVEDKPVVEPTAIITLPNNESGHVNHTITIPVSVFDENGNPLEGDIYALYNGHEKTLSLNNGHASIVMELPNTPMTYYLTVMYNNVSKDCLITVLEENIDIPTNDTTVAIDLDEEITGGIGKTISIPVFVHDGKNNGLEGKIIVIYNGFEREITLNQGVARILIGLPVDPTTFDLTVMYDEFSKTSTIKVIDPNKPKTNISDSDIKISNGDDNSIVIDLPDDATGSIIITINGKDYPAKIINGTVVVDLNELPKGKYNATINFNGDDNYAPFEKEIEVDIKDVIGDNDIKTDTNLSDNGKVVIDLPVNATGDVVVNIGGKNYTGKIVDGKVVLDVKDLPAGNYESIVYYSGDGNYSSSTKTIMVIIKENSNNNTIVPNVYPPTVIQKVSKFSAKKKTFKATKKVKKYKVTLKSGKAPIKNVRVTIKIGKKTFKAKTNIKGKATFKIKKFIQPGKYKAVVKFKGNSQYKPTTKKVKITIK